MDIGHWIAPPRRVKQIERMRSPRIVGDRHPRGSLLNDFGDFDGSAKKAAASRASGGFFWWGLSGATVWLTQQWHPLRSGADRLFGTRQLETDFQTQRAKVRFEGDH